MSELEQGHNEDRVARDDLEDPVFYWEDIARFSGLSQRHAARLIAESGIAEIVPCPGQGRPRVGVRWSKICKLRDEFEEHEELLRQEMFFAI